MNKLPASDILEFNPNQINEVRQLFNYGDVTKLEQDLDNFENWIEKQNHFLVRRFDRNYLERLLMASKGSVEIAKKRLDKLCSFRRALPEYLTNFDVRHEFAATMKWSYSCIMPKPTPDNYRVLVTQVHDPDALDIIDFTQYYRFNISLMDYMFNHDYNAGYEVIFDTRNFTLGVVSKLNPLAMKKAATIFLEAIGLRLKCLHVISGSKLFDVVLTIIKQALTEKLVNRIIVHDNIESIHKYISPDLLPADYGGKGRSIKDLCESTLKEMCSEEHIERLKASERAMTSESHRITLKFDEEYLGMPGSFKTLNVD
ncbi:alpha-tocopherol transfer protein-like [Zerene cesonia]|uniref:alpha-tocopherol transfer protein-like n=1 Tax=Zerene cesonia TaxID=33412 RepID=UPI0018E564FC|nr:alpha-tocopherol transfer protein-like [Zerene cesonia]